MLCDGADEQKSQNKRGTRPDCYKGGAWSWNVAFRVDGKLPPLKNTQVASEDPGQAKLLVAGAGSLVCLC